MRSRLAAILVAGLLLAGDGPEGDAPGTDPATPARPATGVKVEGTIKNYFNLSIPGGAEFAPFVLATSEKQTIVARVASAYGKRDIQVLIGHGDDWEFLGRNGDAVTGVDGNFLQDAKQGPDGRLWVLANYTSPSNPDRGNNHFLYCYEKRHLEAGRPATGAPEREMCRTGLALPR